MQQLPIFNATSREQHVDYSLPHIEEREFAGLLEAAAKISNCPVAVLYITDNNSFSFYTKYGSSINVNAERMLTTKVAVSKKDRYMSENPSEEYLDITFYASIPVSLPQYALVGAISVFDTVQKNISGELSAILKLLAQQVEHTLELQWKNTLLKEAKKQVRLKSNAIKNNLLKQEKQKQEIATKLHEQLAQELASCKMYLQIAQESEQMRLPLLRKVNENLGNFIAEICKLSEDISPNSLNKMPLEELVRDLITEIKAKSTINVEFTIAGDIDSICYEPRMVLFKIIERWTRMLMYNREVSKIRIQISNFDTTIVKILDNGGHHNTAEIANDTTTIKMEHRIEMLGGSGKLTHLRPKGNALTIEI